MELLLLCAVSGLISFCFPQWIPKATQNAWHREWASVLSAGSLLAAVASFRLLDLLKTACANEPDIWRQVRGKTLRAASIGVDFASFVWSIRACTDADSLWAMAAIVAVYISLPKLIRRYAGPRATAPYFALLVGAVSVLGMACLILSAAITEF